MLQIHQLRGIRGLKEGSAKSGMGGVCSLPLPSGVSAIAVHQTKEGEVESRRNSTKCYKCYKS